MAKILLDIDGVMVTTPSWKRVEMLDDGFAAFNNNAIHQLNKILNATNAGIVLTTSHKWNYTIETWLKIFAKRDIHLSSIERLPDNTQHLSRKDEILHWLASTHEEPFVIIDDDKSLNDLPKCFKSQLVLTDFLIGLDENKALNAIEILNPDTHSINPLNH